MKKVFLVILILVMGIVGCTSNTQEEVRKESVSEVVGTDNDEISSEEQELDEKVETKEQDYNYINDEYGVKAKFENDWEINENYVETVLVMAHAPLDNDQDNYREGITVSVENLEGMDISVDEYRTIFLESLGTISTDFTLVETIDETKINGTEYIGFLATFRQGQNDLSYITYITMKNDIAYIMSYCDEIDTIEQNSPNFFEFMDSLIIEAGSKEQELIEKVETKEQDINYINDEYGIKAEFENDWEINENYMELMLVMALAPLDTEQDNYRENISVSVENLEGIDISANEYSTITLENLGSTLTDFTLIETIDESEVNGTMYSGFLSTFRQGEYDLGYMMYFTIKNDIAYTIIYCDDVNTMEQNAPSFFEFMDSLIIE